MGQAFRACRCDTSLTSQPSSRRCLPSRPSQPFRLSPFRPWPFPASPSRPFRPLSAFRRRRFAGHGRHDPDLQLGVDLGVQVDLDRVQAQLLERAFQAHLIGRDVEAGALEGGGDFVGVHAAVEMAFFVGVGLDRDALLGDRFGQLPQRGQAGLFDLVAAGPGASRPSACDGRWRRWPALAAAGSSGRSRA